MGIHIQVSTASYTEDVTFPFTMNCLIVVLLVALVSAASARTTPAPANSCARRQILTRSLAEIALAAALAESERRNLKMNVAGMDDAWLGSADIAMKKARTAVFFNMPSKAIGT